MRTVAAILLAFLVLVASAQCVEACVAVACPSSDVATPPCHRHGGHLPDKTQAACGHEWFGESAGGPRIDAAPAPFWFAASLPVTAVLPAPALSIRYLTPSSPLEARPPLRFLSTVLLRI